MNETSLLIRSGEQLTTVRIGIIGAGPRGLAVLERIVANERQRRSAAIEVILFDPNSPGPGCHDPDQSEIHLVNTVAGQLTLFADESVLDAGPVVKGPSFFQWLNEQSAIGSNDYLRGVRASPDAYYSRGLFGRYLLWAFRYVCALAPPHVKIIVEKMQVNRARRDEDAWLLETPDATMRVNFLFLTTGHTKPSRRAVERPKANPKSRSTLLVDDPYPIRAKLAIITSDMTVAVEGMGLTSFDVVAELTEGRGGRFISTPTGDTQYIRSGREPKLALFSRSGVPLSARACNQKGTSNQYRARFLLMSRVHELRDGRKIDFANDVVPLLVADMEYAYYDAYLTEKIGAVGARLFCDQFVGAGTLLRQALIEQHVHAQDRFSWAQLERPVPEPALANRSAFNRWLKGYLRDDVREAKKGNVKSPLKAACDVLRDLRDNLRAAVEFGGLTETSHRWVLQEFMPVMNRLAVGPPVSRVSELLALMEAGVLTADFGPGAKCEAAPQGGPMTLSSTMCGEQPLKVDALIKARISMHSPRDDASPLLQGLLDDGHLRLFRNGNFLAGGIEIDRNHNWVSECGSVLDNAWALGIPTEGVKFCTFVVPRPGVNSTALVDAGRAVARMLISIRSGQHEQALSVVGSRTEAEASVHASLYGTL